jgi:hypothetical protein
MCNKQIRLRFVGARQIAADVRELLVSVDCIVLTCNPTKDTIRNHMLSAHPADDRLIPTVICCCSLSANTYASAEIPSTQ